MSLSNFLDSSDGLNKNFAVDGIKTVTIFIDSTNTSANDTDTNKYFDNNLSDNNGANANDARAISIRNDKTIEIISMNLTTFTDPIDITLSKGHKETWDKPHLYKLVIKTTVASGTTTNIKIRVK